LQARNSSRISISVHGSDSPDRASRQACQPRVRGWSSDGAGMFGLRSALLIRCVTLPTLGTSERHSSTVGHPSVRPLPYPPICTSIFRNYLASCAPDGNVSGRSETDRDVWGLLGSGGASHPCTRTRILV